MITDRLQQWLDTAALVSRQRWVFGAVAVASVAAALIATISGSDDRFGWISVVTVLLAAWAAIQAGAHTAAVVVALVTLQWLSAIDDVGTARSLVVALCLLTFHTLLALMAVTPHGATVHPEILRRWAWRGGAVAAATTAVWVLVRLFERRDSAANPQLTLLALLVAGAAVVVLLHRSVDDTDA